MTNISMKYLTREETADLFGLSVRTLDTLTKDGNLPSFRVGRSVRCSIDALDKWVKSQQGKGEDDVA